MGFVCFKNLCMIIIFILLTTYYISAFRLIHTHAELPETEPKKNIKELVRIREHKNQSIHVKLDAFETEIIPEKKVKTTQPNLTPETLKEKIKEGLKSKEQDEEEKPKTKIIQKDTQGKSKFVALNEESKEETQKSLKDVKEESSNVVKEDKMVKTKEESSKIVKELFTKKVEDPAKPKMKIIQKDTEGKSKFVAMKGDVKENNKKPSTPAPTKEETKKSKPAKVNVKNKIKMAFMTANLKEETAKSKPAISKEDSSKIVKELFTKTEEAKPKMKIIQKDTEGKGKFVSVTDKSKEEISKVIKKIPLPKETPKSVKEPPVSQKKNSNFRKI